MSSNDYECVIGLEVHIELKTQHKIFCDCHTTFGAPPNTQVCPVCLAMPGTLPVLNPEVVEFAVRAGLATHCEISRQSRMERKHYFYPDLPKAYQLSQDAEPLCVGGYVDITTEDGHRRVRLNRIHIEEDAGKLIHNADGETLIDCNRCGVPLIEIVSEPDMRSADEAVAYLRKLRAMAMYTGISDGRMNEGSMRCDVNLSVRPRGSDVLGTRTEMKNINSFNYVAKAIEAEFARQVKVLDEGGTIAQETRRYDEKTNQTTVLRSKENAADYRYFHDPDQCLVEITDEEIEAVRKSIPRLPDERKQDYQSRYGLTEYDAERLTADREMADFFEAAAAKTAYPKVLTGLILTDLAPYFDDNGGLPDVHPEAVAALAEMLGSEEINSNTGRRVLKALLDESFDPVAYVKAHDLTQIKDEATLAPVVAAAVESNPRAVRDFRNGKEAAIKALLGRIMKETKGRAHPLVAEQMLRELIASQSDEA